MDVLEILFLLILASGVILNFLSIPGNFIILADSLWYGFATGFNRFSFSFLITIFIVALIIELLEYFIIAFGARRFGSTKMGAVAGIIGGIIGSLSGYFFSPVLGAIIGGLLGVIIGTVIIELLAGKTLRDAFHAMIGALLGRVGGFTIKVIGSFAMLVIIASKFSF